MSKQRMTPAVIGVAWLVSLGVVFVLGILSAFAFHRAPEFGLDAGLEPADRELAFAMESLTGEAADLAALKSVSARDAFPPQLERALERLAGMEPGLRRSFLTDVLARGLPMRPVVASVQYLAEQPTTEGRRFLTRELMFRWGELDGRSAAAFAATRTAEAARKEMLGAVLSGWARVSAGDAWSWAMRQEVDDAVRSRFLGRVAAAEAEVDLESAVARVGALDDAGLQGVVMRALTDWLVDNLGGEQALPWLVEMDPDGLPLDLIVYFARRWADMDPWMAAEWAAGLDGMAREEVYGAVAAQWASRDPAEAARWAYGLPRGMERMTMLRRIVGQWIRLEGLEFPTEWLAARDADRDLDGAVEAVVVALVELNPAAAFSWAMSIMDRTRRDVAVDAVARYWLEVDPGAAAPVLAEELPASVAVNLFAEPEPEPAPVPPDPGEEAAAEEAAGEPPAEDPDFEDELIDDPDFPFNDEGF